GGPGGGFPRPGGAGPVGGAVFGGAGGPALGGARVSAGHLHHVVGAGAMVYMAVVMAATQRGAHHGGAGIPALTAALLLYFTAYVLVTGARLVPVPALAGGPGVGPRTGSGTGWGDRPELARACRLSMGIAMVAMLLTM
ncbi:DUF5134 domain-containing protein, partial [Streptomyces albogriseolus]|uniref:DUF5134 domain-containing protein n=1 Tax=Streptomyces albogriseolus TaxID=1887 RepID=UPI0036B92BCD